MDYSKIMSNTFGFAQKGNGGSADAAYTYTHVSNTRRHFINRGLAFKLGLCSSGGGKVPLGILYYTNEDGEEVLVIGKPFGATAHTSGKYSNGTITFYGTPLGNYIESVIGRVEINKSVRFDHILYDTDAEGVVRAHIILNPKKKEVNFSALVDEFTDEEDTKNSVSTGEGDEDDLPPEFCEDILDDDEESLSEDEGVEDEEPEEILDEEEKE